MNTGEWGKWLRDNSDKFLLMFAIMYVLGLTLHLIHRNLGDNSQLQFMNGITNTLVGGLLGLITGSVLRKTSTASTTTQGTDGKAVIATAKEEEK